MLVVVDDLHRPAAQHERRPHQHRVADALGDVAIASSSVLTAAPGGCGMPSRSQERSKSSRSSATSIASQRTAEHAARRARSSGSARLIAVWPPNWTITGGIRRLAGPSFSSTSRTLSSSSGSK